MSNSIVEPQNSGFIKDEGREFFEQLIILGNGFDLACGLKSSYSDFFDYIFTKKSLQNNYWYKVFNYSNRDNSNKDNNWTDIESKILMELQNLEFLFHFHLLQDLKKEIENDEYIRADLDEIKRNYSNNIYQLISEVSRVTGLGIQIKKFLNSHLKYDYLNFHSVVGTASILIIHAFNSISFIEDVHNYLKGELIKLESDFKKFLKQQIELAIEEFDLAFNSDSQTDYKLKQYFWTSRYLFWILLNDSLPAATQFDYYFDNSGDCLTVPPSFERFWETHGNFLTLVDDLHKNYMIHNSVLSFNYTNPFQDSARIRNIHGDLDSNNLIFGIDYDKLNSHFDTPPIKFSKSYRILENDTTSSFNITPRIKIVKFYGHGLGAADYAYFQSIVDTVDLYHGTTKLIFFWSTYKGADKDFLYKEQVKKVVNLIEEYGSTFTNQNHGRNLLTKLQLEDRLVIKEIKSIENL